MPQDMAATEDGVDDFYSRQNTAVIMGSLFQPLMINECIGSWGAPFKHKQQVRCSTLLLPCRASLLGMRGKHVVTSVDVLHMFPARQHDDS